MALSVGLGHREAVADNATCNAPYNRPDGTLIRNPADGKVYLIDGCRKRHISDPIAFDSHRFDGSWGAVKDVSAQELAGLPDGPQIRVREGTVLVSSQFGYKYIIDESPTPGQYYKRYITQNGWTMYFAVCGSYNTYPVTYVSQEYLNTYPSGSNVTDAGKRPDGQRIQAAGQAAQYLIVNGYKRWITDVASLNSYNFAEPLCVTSTTEVDSFPSGGSVRAREGTLVKDDRPEVWIIDWQGASSYQKRHIAGMTSFDYYGFTWDRVRSWSRTDVNGYSSGTHAHPYKSLLPVAWSKNLITDDLTMNRSYDGVTSGSWDSQITGARDAWNSAPIAPDFVEGGTGTIDVPVKVIAPGWTPFAGWVSYDYDAWGRVVRANVYLNGGSYLASQPLVAHELGHALLLDHDGVDPDANGDGTPEMDGQCGSPRVPQTIMDYDCYVTFGLTGPAGWDFCGVNHKHPTGGWSGC